MSKLNLLGSILLAGLLSLPASGDILYETATNGGVANSGGNAILPAQFLGSRFTLMSSADITNITVEAEFIPPSSEPGSANLFFMTVLALPSPGALPNNLFGDPFEGTTQLYTTTFSAGPLSSAQDVSIPVSLSVSAGTYAVIIGSGLFGSPMAMGYMPSGPSSGNVIQPDADLIIWYDSINGSGDFADAEWHNSINSGERFVVEGTTPESSSATLHSLGIAVILLRRVFRLSARV